MKTEEQAAGHENRTLPERRRPGRPRCAQALRIIHRNYGPTLSTLALLLLSWELLARFGGYNAALFPPPSQLFSALMTMAQSGELFGDVAASLQRVVSGYALGVCLGVLVGCLTGRSRFCDLALGRTINLFRPVPAIALVPFAVLWFGLGETSKIFLIAWGTFFPIWIGTHTGVSRVDQTFVWAARSLGAGKWVILAEVVLPSATPLILAGARISIAVAFTCLVAAEMAGASNGVGYRVSVADLMFQRDKMLVSLASLGVLGASADGLFSKLTAKLFPWDAPKPS